MRSRLWGSCTVCCVSPDDQRRRSDLPTAIPKLRHFYFTQNREVEEWGRHVGPESARYKWFANLCLVAQLPLMILYTAFLAIGIHGNIAVLRTLGYLTIAVSFYLLVVVSSRFNRRAIQSERIWREVQRSHPTSGGASPVIPAHAHPTGTLRSLIVGPKRLSPAVIYLIFVLLVGCWAVISIFAIPVLTHRFTLLVAVLGFATVLAMYRWCVHLRTRHVRV